MAKPTQTIVDRDPDTGKVRVRVLDLGGADLADHNARLAATPAKVYTVTVVAAGRALHELPPQSDLTAPEITDLESKGYTVTELQPRAQVDPE